MILFKDFYRSKKIKVYIGLITLMITVINVILGFSLYYKKMINNENYNSVLLYSKDKSVLQDKVKNKYGIVNVKKALMIQLNSITAVVPPDIAINFLDNQGEKEVIIYKDENLLGNQVIINISKFYYNILKDDLKNIKKLNIFHDYLSEDIIITKINSHKYSNMILSNELYDKIYKNENVIYTFDLKDYGKKEKILNETLLNDINIVQNYDDNSQYETISSMEKTLNILKSSCYVICFIFLIIFIIITHSIMFEEFYKMKINWIMGFSILRIKIILFFRFLSMVFLSMLISMMLIALLEIILSFFKINVIINKSLFTLITILLGTIPFIIVLFIKHKVYKESM